MPHIPARPRRWVTALVGCLAVVLAIPLYLGPATFVVYVLESMQRQVDYDPCGPPSDPEIRAAFAETLRSSPVITSLPAGTTQSTRSETPGCLDYVETVRVVFAGSATAEPAGYTEHYRTVLQNDGWTVGTSGRAGAMICGVRTLRGRVVMFSLWRYKADQKAPPLFSANLEVVPDSVACER